MTGDNTVANDVFSSRLLRWLIPDHNPAGTVYGILVVGTLLAAESSSATSFPALISAVLVALGLYWFAHAYASVLGERLNGPERWTPWRLGAALVHEFGLVLGAIPPVLALTLSAASGASMASAVNVALAACMAWLVVLEVAAGLGEDLSWLEIAGEALVGAALGLGLFAVRILLH